MPKAKAATKKQAASTPALPTLDEACALLLQNETPAFRTSTETLYKIVKNILDQPDEAKFRSLRRNGKAFTENLAHAKGAVRFLRAVGFAEVGAGDDAAYALPASADAALLTNGKAALKAVVKAYAAQEEAQRVEENAAAAVRLRDLQELSKQNANNRNNADGIEREKQRMLAARDREDYARQRDPTNMR